ncbi:MBA1 (YBR185C) [Zygosaccharomyces parabailii]|uniref:BN860_06414g1_1 n=1 Tax=Zygosaccharomyces bailii (strain CLIB 213 / ATCC 58445 / CBS 680 / BCRC 21525 / NBRC 1098 / NCYC 1416 / NRRL Y-2227) TaxID=1333698 RepID=A0A8J2X627_ZYGB2|nr:MBA1 (YBR185C) [Zygosaccharomyces parabailii]CDF88281.1 BN860_06414g1_1 [Zygosaccharomyces bailii CLIB 213]CDH14824.1 probable MBA1-Respiratory chain assembly protein [Zygosaccharomyces bailii ISA1307]SJM81830.1 probable protein MBA1, mitochondrial [Zygosaccharomyces bailii]
MLKVPFIPAVMLKPSLFHSTLKCTWRVRQQNRLFSNSRAVFEKSASKNNSSPTDFNARHLGVSSEIYVPPSFKNLPSIFSHPIVVFNALIRRIYTMGLNTVQVGIFRYQSGLKPNFLLWKNKAIENYVNVNSAFAQHRIATVKSQISMWVEEALEARSKQLPKHIQLEWQLVKFNRIPKVVCVQAMMIPGRPLEHIQLVYKFDTKQRLIKLNKKSGQVDKVDRDVVDYLVFLCDASTNDLTLMGSVFESQPASKLPKTYEDNTQAAIQRMKVCGDLFRLPSQQ